MRVSMAMRRDPSPAGNAAASSICAWRPSRAGGSAACRHCCTADAASAGSGLAIRAVAASQPGSRHANAIAMRASRRERAGEHFVTVFMTLLRGATLTVRSLPPAVAGAFLAVSAVLENCCRHASAQGSLSARAGPEVPATAAPSPRVRARGRRRNAPIRSASRENPPAACMPPRPRLRGPGSTGRWRRA